MKKFVLGIVALLSFNVAFAQTTVHPGPSYVLPVVAVSGPIAPSLAFVSNTPPAVYPPITFNISWANTATAATACTFEIDGSSDGVNWFVMVPSAACTALTGVSHVSNGPALYVRVNVLTFTGPGSALSFTYTGTQTTFPLYY